MSSGPTLENGFQGLYRSETAVSTELDRKGTNTPVVKGTAHTGMKYTREKDCDGNF